VALEECPSGKSTNRPGRPALLDELGDDLPGDSQAVAGLKSPAFMLLEISSAKA
jgi:hypothetical protein